MSRQVCTCRDKSEADFQFSIACRDNHLLVMTSALFSALCFPLRVSYPICLFFIIILAKQVERGFIINLHNQCVNLVSKAHNKHIKTCFNVNEIHT